MKSLILLTKKIKKRGKIKTKRITPSTFTKYRYIRACIIKARVEKGQKNPSIQNARETAYVGGCAIFITQEMTLPTGIIIITRKTPPFPSSFIMRS